MASSEYWLPCGQTTAVIFLDKKTGLNPHKKKTLTMLLIQARKRKGKNPRFWLLILRSVVKKNPPPPLKTRPFYAFEQENVLNLKIKRSRPRPSDKVSQQSHFTTAVLHADSRRNVGTLNTAGMRMSEQEAVHFKDSCSLLRNEIEYKKQ